ncbi:hypothetical protein Tco_1241901 [Tanacetum coccineum]
MEEINKFQKEPDETIYQAWERFKELLMKFPQNYLIERGAVPTKTAEDAKKAIQEMAECSQKWHNETSRGRNTDTSDGLAAIQAQLNNLGREIKHVNEKVYAAQVGCEQCKGPLFTQNIATKEGWEKTLESLYMHLVTFQGGGYRATALEQYTNVQGKTNDDSFSTMIPFPSRVKVYYVIMERRDHIPQFLSITLKLHISESLDPLNGDYIELNDLNEPFELRINQGNDLIPTIEEGDVIEEFRTRDEDLDTGIDDCP